MSADYDLKPYRVEWQFSMNIHWTPVTSCDDHDGALATAEAHVEQYGGYCRVIAQHVIHRTRGTQPAQA